MPVTVACRCGETYELRDEYANQLVQCPKCGQVHRATLAAAPLTATSDVDPVFNRDVFLLRQRHMSINQKYLVFDQKGDAIVFVERPSYLLRNVLAVFVGLAAVFAVMVLFAIIAPGPSVTDEPTLADVLFFPTCALAFVLAASYASKKRHVTFYRGSDSGGERLLEVSQDQKLQIPWATYTIRDARGQALAKLRKNYLYNFFRKRWQLLSLNGDIEFVAKEDSIILSLLRRVLGPLFGFLRTNFILTNNRTNANVGEFKRNFTILDRYVLDLTPDRARVFDRRFALALGVMLDTGERR